MRYWDIEHADALRTCRGGGPLYCLHDSPAWLWPLGGAQVSIVCMCVCVYVLKWYYNKNILIHTHIYIYVRVNIYMYIWYMYVYIHTFTCTYSYTHIYTHTHTCTHTYTYTWYNRYEVRRSWNFRFDWFIKSRTPKELENRFKQLVRLIEKELEAEVCTMDYRYMYWLDICIDRHLLGCRCVEVIYVYV